MPAGYRIAACYEPSQIRTMGDRPVVLAATITTSLAWTEGI